MVEDHSVGSCEKISDRSLRSRSRKEMPVVSSVLRSRGQVVAERCVDAKTANDCFRSVRPYREVVPPNRTELNALKYLISQADLMLSTTDPLPENRTPACRELLRAALALTDDLLKQARMPAAAALGHKGGSTTAQRHGTEHYRQMAAARKTHAGGRPRKQAE